MINNVSGNFDSLVDSISQLNNGKALLSADSSPAKPDAPSTANTKAFRLSSSSMSSTLQGFEGAVGERYTLSKDDTIKFLQMFAAVLTEIMDTVANNSNNPGNSANLAAPQGNVPQNATGMSGTNGTTTNGMTSADNNTALGETGRHSGDVHKNTAQNSQAVSAGNSAESAAATDGASGHASHTTSASGGGCPYLATQNDTGADGAEGTNRNAAGDMADDRGIDFTRLSAAERSEMGMSDRERAVVHLWGRQMISAGEQNGGIYTNVLGKDGTGSEWKNKEEVALVKELRAAEHAGFGTDTGWLLDEMYFGIMKEKTGEDWSARYANRPVNESKGPVNITTDIATLQNQAGINEFDQGVLRLMGHDALMDGEFDGSILEYTIGNNNALDGVTHSKGNQIDGTANILLERDMADDNIRNGSSLIRQTAMALDKLYKV